MKQAISLILLLLTTLVFGQINHFENHTFITQKTISFEVDLMTLQKTLNDNLSRNPSETTIHLPTPQTVAQKFYIKETFILDTDLQEAFPAIKTYQITSKNGLSSGNLTVTPNGLFASILTPDGLLGIAPIDMNAPNIHRATFENQSSPAPCGLVEEEHKGNKQANASSNLDKNLLIPLSNGSFKRTYRLAVGATGEFVQANGGSVSSAMAVITATVNGISTIFDTDLAVNFIIAAPTNTNIWTDSTNDPFIPESAGGDKRTEQAAAAIDMAYPNPNDYDLGHVFHTTTNGGSWNLGGIAKLGVVCSSMTNATGGYNKAGGWSSSTENTSNGWIQLATHEFGHMFNATHTFNGTGENCTDAINETSAVEIASGTTIMAYNNICGSGQNIGDDGPSNNYFHGLSIEQMVDYINANNCETQIAPHNTPPVIDASLGNTTYQIPLGTPFILEGSATDADGDILTYTWEQVDDDGTGSPTQSLIGAAAAANPNAPIIRSYPPSLSPNRTIPTLNKLINNISDPFEILSSVARTMDFRLTVRDQNVDGGGVSLQDLTIDVDASGPFVFAGPSAGSSFQAGSTTTVSWNPNGSEALAQNVNIRLSTDGGNTYPYNLGSADYASGSASITFPEGAPNTNTARLLIVTVNDGPVKFFDISDADFSIDSDCLVKNNYLCNAGPIELSSDDPNLNLDLDYFLGTPLSNFNFNVTTADPLIDYIRETAQNSGICQMSEDGFFNYDANYQSVEILVDVTGTYTFNKTGGQVVSIFDAATFDPVNPCASFVATNAYANNDPPDSNTGFLSSGLWLK